MFTLYPFKKKEISSVIIQKEKLLKIMCKTTKSEVYLQILDTSSAGGGGGVMVFNATFYNILVISWRPVLLEEETGIPGENPRACHKSLTNFST